MAKQNQPNIVFAHGLWADGTCFQKLIPALPADGHEVMWGRLGNLSALSCRPKVTSDLANCAIDPTADMPWRLDHFGHVRYQP
jgi:hypothetical protein